MALTEKGRQALNHIQKYFPTGIFTAAELSEACGERIVAATLNGMANHGYIQKLGGSPIQYKAINDLEKIISARLAHNLGSSPKSSTIRDVSSVGQSFRLITGWS